EDQTAHDGAPAPTSLLTAIVRIAVADLVMSLDNVIAIAGVSESDPVLLAVVGRFRWIVYAGSGFLALTAAGMIVHDVEVFGRVAWTAGSTLHFPLWADWCFRGAVVVACLPSRRWWPRRVPAAEAAGRGMPEIS